MTRLSYHEGLIRTWGVFGMGMGYAIPIYTLVRLWKSYKLCREQEVQPWDINLSYTIKDTKRYRALLFILGWLVSFALLLLILATQWLPPNRGNLTIEEFAQNYNYYTKMLNINVGNHYLDENGKWAEKDVGETVYWDPAPPTPELQYTLEQGYVKGVSFSEEFVDQQNVLPSYDLQVLLLCFSMLGAQKEVGLFSRVPNEVMTQIDSFQGFEVTRAKLTIRCNTQHTGYIESETGDLYPVDTEEEPYFCIHFSIEKGAKG